MPQTPIELTSMRILADEAGFPVTEETVRRCLDPLYLPDYEQVTLLPDGETEPVSQRELDERYEDLPPPPEGYGGVVLDSDTNGILHALLRTGGIFCLDPDDGGGALESAWDGAAPSLPELPPLPFRRVVIEGRRDGKPAPLLSLPEGEGGYWNIVLIGFSEVERGQMWDAVIVRQYDVEQNLDPMPCPLHRESHDDCPMCEGSGQVDWAWWAQFHNVGEPTAGFYRIRAAADGAFVVDRDSDLAWGELFAGEDEVAAAEARAGELTDDPDEQDNISTDAVERVAEKNLVGFAITAAHLLTARGVRHTARTFPRAQRREMTRKLRLLQPPRVYFIELDPKGQHPEGGASDREYHVRWLVRGHWRLSAHGDTFVRAKGGPCVWVRPHIKGPAGAPWKGRPVHVTT